MKCLMVAILICATSLVYAQSAKPIIPLSQIDFNNSHQLVSINSQGLEFTHGTAISDQYSYEILEDRIMYPEIGVHHTQRVLVIVRVSLDSGTRDAYLLVYKQDKQGAPVVSLQKTADVIALQSLDNHSFNVQIINNEYSGDEDEWIRVTEDITYTWNIVTHQFDAATQKY